MQSVILHMDKRLRVDEAQSFADPELEQLAVNEGLESHPDLDSANASPGHGKIGIVFFNSTTKIRETTTSAS